MTREELYEKVWSTPSTILAKELGFSDAYLVRVCRALDVPKPSPGYWQRKRVGIEPPRPELPEPSPSTPLKFVRGAVSPQLPKKPIREKTSAQLHSKGQKRLHPLIAESLEDFRHAEARENLLLYPRKKLLPDILISQSGLSKGLELANNLFLNLEKKSYPVMISPLHANAIRLDAAGFQMEGAWHDKACWNPLRPTITFIQKFPIGLIVSEKTEERDYRYVGFGRHIPESQYDAALYPPPTWKVKRTVPTGKFQLVAYSTYPQLPWMQAWDESNERLDLHLDAVIASLEAAAIELSLRRVDGDFP